MYASGIYVPGMCSKDLIESGWHSRGYLPHFDGGVVTQFITFHLFDSLPQTALEKWRLELARNDDAALRRRVEAYLDQGYGSSFLKTPRVASLVQGAMLHMDGARYHLAAWVVMPNHMHLLLTPRRGHTLPAIMHSLKSHTSSEANKLLGRRGHFSMKESFDRYIRDARHFAQTITYIENNPVKAKLCRTPRDWPFSSAHFRT